MRYYEDLHVGDVYDCGSRILKREEIIKVAENWDPQAIHTDETAVKDSPFHDIIASGVHTFMVTNRLGYDGLFADVEIVAGRGISDFRFPNPVYPGDEIRVQVSIVDKFNEPDSPERGLGYFRFDGEKQRGEPVITFLSQTYVKRRS